LRAVRDAGASRIGDGDAEVAVPANFDCADEQKRQERRKQRKFDQRCAAVTLP
jgi:rRNA maturation protein Nop10